MYGVISDNDDTEALSSVDIVAKTIYGEARNQGYQGMQAVANVIANRVKIKGWWGDDFRSVCLKNYQFSCWLQADPNRNIIMSATITDPIYAQCVNIAKLAIGGQLPDIVCGADSYEVTGTNAVWGRTLHPVAVIGSHSFYMTVGHNT